MKYQIFRGFRCINLQDFFNILRCENASVLFSVRFTGFEVIH